MPLKVVRSALLGSYTGTVTVSIVPKPPASASALAYAQTPVTPFPAPLGHAVSEGTKG